MEAHDAAVIQHVLHKVRTLVKERGMSGAELVRRSGVPRGTLYAALRPDTTQNLTLDQVWAIAHGLRMSPAELLPLDRSELPKYPNPESSITADQRALLDAVDADDAAGVREALLALMSRVGFATLIGGPALSESDRETFLKAVADAAAKLKVIADLGRLPAELAPTELDSPKGDGE